jgi:hypothetical protein
MINKKLQVFDPPKCTCGSCGPDMETELARFSDDLEWLKTQGMDVERYNLSDHPDKFSEQECVRNMISIEGDYCLPLILVDGEIVSKRLYLSRNELIRVTGISNASDEKQSEDATASLTPSNGEKNENAACGPGCNCQTSTEGKMMKVVITFFILLAIVGILVYKIPDAGRAAANDASSGGAETFSLAQTGGEAISDKEVKPGDNAEVQKTNINSVTETPPNNSDITHAQPETKEIVEQHTLTSDEMIGEFLDSFSDLNRVALSLNTVFIFIPNEKNDPISPKAKKAVLAAQKDLKAKKVTLGLYTLRINSRDYPVISKQIKTPAILIATKGRGQSTVSGDVTKDKILQAYVASSSAGSACCPSSSGKTDCK